MVTHRGTHSATHGYTHSQHTPWRYRFECFGEVWNGALSLEVDDKGQICEKPRHIARKGADMVYFDVWERLDAFLESLDEDLVVYVYRLSASGGVIKPFLLKASAWPGLLWVLRDEYHGGRFRILIRRKRNMVFRGDISIALPIRKQNSGL